jgi:hypothetical protein
LGDGGHDNLARPETPMQSPVHKLPRMEIDWRPPDNPTVLALAAAQQAELDRIAPDADAVRYALHPDIEFAVGSVDYSACFAKRLATHALA